MDIDKARSIEERIQKIIEELRSIADETGKLGSDLGYAESLLLDVAHGKVRQALREVRAAIRLRQKKESEATDG